MFIYIYTCLGKINISCLTNSSNSRKDCLIRSTAFLRWFTKEEIYFIIIWIIGVGYGKSSNKFCSCLKEKSFKLKYWNNLATIVLASFVCKTISRIKKKWTMNRIWEMKHTHEINMTHVETCISMKRSWTSFLGTLESRWEQVK